MPRKKAFLKKIFSKKDNDNILKNVQKDYKWNILLHRAGIMKKVIIGIVVIVLIIVGVNVFFNNKEYSQYNIASEVERGDAVATQYREYGSNILKYSNDGISCTDYKNTTIWNLSYEMQNPIVDISGEYVAAADLKGTQIFIMDMNGQKGEIKTTLQIQQIQVASQGVVYAVMEDGTDMWIYAYNYDGTVLAKSKQPMSSSGYPIKISVSDDGEKLMVSYLYVDSGIMNTKIAFHNFGSVGQNESDNLVSAYTYDGMIFPVVEFLNQSTSVAIGDSKLVLYKGTQKPKMYKEVDLETEVNSAYFSDKYIALIIDNEDGNGKYRIDIYNTDGDKILSKVFDYNYENVILYDKGFTVVNNNEFVSYNMSGVEKFHYEAQTNIVSVIKPDKWNRYVIIDSNNTKVINLKIN